MSIIFIVLLSLTGFLATDTPVYYEWIEHINFIRCRSLCAVLCTARGLSTSTLSGAAPGLSLCVLLFTTETRHLNRLRQLSEFEQDSNTNSEQESNKGSHSARNKAHAAQQSAIVLLCAASGSITSKFFRSGSLFTSSLVRAALHAGVLRVSC